jgi:aminopeptidase YwaD
MLKKLIILLLISPTLAFKPMPQEKEKSLNNLKNIIKYLTSEQLSGRYPGTYGHEMSKRYIFDSLNNLSLSPEIIETKGRFPWDEPIKNIIGKINSSNYSKECIVFSAHYDHNKDHKKKYQPGANDNASGIAALLQLASSLKKEGFQPDVNIYFTFPDQEENYIAGSPDLVEYLTSQCSRILFNVNLDIVGGKFFHGYENNMLALGSESSISLQTLFKLTPSVENLNIKQGGIYLIEPAGKIIPRSDYASFRKQKIPFVFFTSGTPYYYHSHEDTEDKIEYEYLYNFTRYLRNILYAYKNRGITLPFIFNQNPKLLIGQDYKILADLLKKYAENPIENKLDEKTEKKFLKISKDIKDKGKNNSKFSLQYAIIQLLISIKENKPNI